MASALARSAQVSWRLGREAEVAEVLMNDAGATEEQDEDAILHDHITDTSSQCPFNAQNE